MVSPEAVVLVSLPLRADPAAEAMAPVRGVSQLALEVRSVVKIGQGRFFKPGLAELVVGGNVAKTYKDCEFGGRPFFGGVRWRVVGVLDAGGSAFDSEIWADTVLLQQTYKRPGDIFQSATIRLTSPEAFPDFVKSLSGDPRLTVQIDRERDYYERQSQAVTTIIRVLGVIVAIVMGIGAIFGALNTMYSSVAARAREIATVRAIGFAEWSIVVSFLLESLFIALIGGAIGCIAVIPINGYSTSTINWQTFSNLAFAFEITPALLCEGMLFALFMGFVGGLPPAVRAARMPVITALREL
jgi:putative ABC transport system permease protein